MYYRIRLLQGSFRWFVWVTFNNIEEVFTNLVNTYPSIAVPKLIPMSTSQYDKLRNNTVASNNEIEKACFFIYQFKNIYPRGKSYSSSILPTENTPGGYKVDTNRIHHEQVLILNWLKGIKNNTMLANSEYMRQLFHLQPYVEKPVAAAILPSIPGSASKNKSDIVDDGIVRFTGNSYDNIRFILTYSLTHSLTHSLLIMSGLMTNQRQREQCILIVVNLIILRFVQHLI